MATLYELDGPGIESRWGWDFPHTSRPALGAQPASCTVCTGSLPGVKRPGRGVYHPPRSSVEFKERVEPYLYSPSGPSWPVLRRILCLHLFYTFNASPDTWLLCWCLQPALVTVFSAKNSDIYENIGSMVIEKRGYRFCLPCKCIKLALLI